MTPEWKDAFSYAATLADQLGLEMAIAGSPGWSETGGPWVTPAQAMKKLVWSETRVEGGQPFTGALPKPPTTNGPFPERAARRACSRVVGAARRRSRSPSSTRTAPSSPIRCRPATCRWRACARWSRRAAGRSMRRCSPTATSSSRRPCRRRRVGEGVDPVRFRTAGGDPRRVAGDGRVQVAVRPAAARSRSRSERRRPGLPEDRQHPAQHGRAEHRVVRTGPGPLLPGGVRAAAPADFGWRSTSPLPPPPAEHQIAELVLHAGARVNRFEEKAAFAPLPVSRRFRRPRSLPKMRCARARSWT